MPRRSAGSAERAAVLKPEVLDLGRQANANSPVLHNFDRSGRRVDEVEFHPSWHALMSLMIGAKRACLALGFGLARRPGRAAQYLLFGQVENGAQCPVTMTYASVLRRCARPGRSRPGGCPRFCRASTIRARCRSSRRAGP
ncbi:hypothetical protein LP419_00495 [Massilia sp. H-1]|nr:hypothetical protein LP419_00495 [Massilia sp. H-1]